MKKTKLVFKRKSIHLVLIILNVIGLATFVHALAIGKYSYALSIAPFNVEMLLFVSIVFFTIVFYLFSSHKKINKLQLELIKNKNEMAEKPKFELGNESTPPKELVKLKTLSAVNTLTKKKENQDACFINETGNIIAVADGVGSHPFAAEGSKFVVETACAFIEVDEDLRTIDFYKLFADVQIQLDEFIKENFLPKNPDLKQGECFGTTLIIAIDLPDKYIVAYLGNGCVYHLRGNFTDLSENVYLPWHSVNMLNPHVIQQEGREALYKIFAFGNSSDKVHPTVLEISKDNKLFGDILMIGVDGVYSADHSLPGMDGDDNIWIPSSKVMELFYKRLKSFLTSPNTTFTSEETEKMLADFLSEVKSRNVMDDDTTLGMFISEQCLNYHNRKK